ncbi:PaaI family thioesterase [Larsenimonas rhizosphaerae]|uniref:PaaI family thioesterase n=1 Tax=Larsenimonas rhizosphaerae TaxID=2944682 RepID=A0AA42CWZ1_9GAMM|nr:PaaI family thioesterase [Larsenimonas rhizosphaerae]MCM2130561.1 PaaI family thioesterase [Larsenimonas rhizosphaerae]MCX2523265.1 PaaI family thioesterase [Larsenimonas rhizosphaerae]
MNVVSAGPSGVEMRLPWKADFLGDVSRQLIHGGVITMVLDTACTGTVLCGLGDPPEICPTLDLRVDHFRPAVAGQALLVRARITEITASVVFVEGELWQENDQKRVARATGSFARLPAEATPANFGRLLCGRPGAGTQGVKHA